MREREAIIRTRKLPFTEKNERFCRRVFGNYELMRPDVRRRGLRHAMPGRAAATGDISSAVTVVNQHNRMEQQMHVTSISQIKNRLIFLGTPDFTYQDLVYVSAALRRAGIPDHYQQLWPMRDPMKKIGLLYRYRVEAPLHYAPADPVPSRVKMVTKEGRRTKKSTQETTVQKKQDERVALLSKQDVRELDQLISVHAKAQVRLMADRAYEKLEKRLRDEKKRRGF